MKKYQIYYNNTVEINNVAEFDTLDEASNIVPKIQKGMIRYATMITVGKVAAITFIMKSMMELRKS